LPLKKWASYHANQSSRIRLRIWVKRRATGRRNRVFYSHAPKPVGVPSNIDLKSINLSETFLISAPDLQ
jgi:hypothetical protein